MLLDQGDGSLRLDVAEDGHDHVARDKALGMELLQIGHGQGLDRLRLALGIHVIGRRGRQGVEEQFADLGMRVGAAVLDVGQQQRLGLLELVLGDGRVQEGIGEQPGRLGKIFAAGRWRCRRA